MNTESWKNATPEQRNLWNYAKGLIAFNTITPIYFAGAPGAPYTVYNAAILYIALRITFSYSTSAAIAGSGLVTTYNEANAINQYYINSKPVWDTTAAALKYSYGTIEVQNIFFSRIAVSTYGYMVFNGYSLTTV